MDALTPTFWVGVVAIVIALGGLFWGKHRIDHLKEQLVDERTLHGETIRAMEVRLSTTEALLEDARLMNPTRIRQYAVDMVAMQGEEIVRLGAKLEEAEEKAVDNLKTKAERDSGLEEIALLKREIALFEAEREITRRFSAGVTFSGTLNPRYIPQAPEDFSHLHNCPDEEGESA